MYNATLYQIDPKTKETIGIYLAEVNTEGRIVRSTWMEKTRLEGSSEYETILRTTGCYFHAAQDGGRAFWQTAGMFSVSSGRPYSAHDP